jgi:hypothetical protein
LPAYEAVKLLDPSGNEDVTHVATPETIGWDAHAEMTVEPVRKLRVPVAPPVIVAVNVTGTPDDVD